MTRHRAAFRNYLATLCLAGALSGGCAVQARQCDWATAGHKAYDAHNYATAFRLLTADTAAGDACAQQTLGVMYYLGYGTPPNQAAGHKMWLESYAKGNINAAYPLAVEYEKGDAQVPQDWTMARTWLVRGGLSPERADREVAETRQDQQEVTRLRQKEAEDEESASHAPPNPDALIRRQQMAEEAVQAQVDKKIVTYIEGVIHADSGSWSINHFVDGSFHDVILVHDGRDKANYTIRGSYEFTDGSKNVPQSGWVSVKVVHNKAQCLTYWDFPDSCRAPGNPNSFVVGAAVLGAAAAVGGASGAASAKAGGGDNYEQGSGAYNQNSTSGLSSFTRGVCRMSFGASPTAGLFESPLSLENSLCN